MPTRDPFDRYGRPTDPTSNLEPRSRFLDDVPLEPVFWLWPHRFPIGQLSLLVGDPGVGKSLLAADLAARVSANQPWPDADLVPPPPLPPGVDPRNYLMGYHGAVLFVSPEDCANSVLRPRLAAAGAVLDRVCLLEGVAPARFRLSLPSSLGPSLPSSPDDADSTPLALSLPDHLPVLAQAVRGLAAPRLLVLDPLHALLSPAAQSGSDALLRVLAGLANIARSYSVAVVAVGHLAKSHTSRTLYRVRGSLALIAAARCVHLLTTDPDHSADRILVPLKTVYGPPPPPLSFSITPGPRLVWKDRASATLAAPDLFDLPPAAQSALSEACDWLSSFLAAADRPASQAIETARVSGIPLITLRRAKRLLGVRSRKLDADGPWLWYLERPNNQGDHPGGVQR